MAFVFTDDQQAAMDSFIDFLASDEQIMIIQGSSGCGKSTLIRHMAEAVKAREEMYRMLLKKDVMAEEFRMALTATTNPAAAVLHDLTALPSSTIHRMLGLIVRPNFQTGGSFLSVRRDQEPIRNALIIIDESSMMDDVLYGMMQKQIIDSKVVLIGDWYQLAPVGQKYCTTKNITCRTALMNQIMRNSGIIQQTGQQFRETVETGVFKPIPTGHPEIIHADGRTFQHLVDMAYLDPMYGLKTAKILAWTNARVLEYSSYIRQLLGKPEELQVGETVFTNKMIDMGKSGSIPVDSAVTITYKSELIENRAHENILGWHIGVNNMWTAFMPQDPQRAKTYMKKLASKKDWPTHYEVKDGWLDLRLPYASTVHKAQGQTLDTVFIDLDDIGRCRDADTVARMLYVAITRARKQVVLYGQLPKKYRGK